MNKAFLLAFLSICFYQFICAQSPHAFRYQAVIRDTTGVVIANQLVSLKISILQGDVGGEAVYSELHDIVTNQLGLVNLDVGRGLTIHGNFSEISWGADTYSIQIELDLTGGTNYSFVGASQLLSVPYALYAENSGSTPEPDTIISQWKDAPSGIYYDEGRVGIGTTDPQAILHVNGQSNMTQGRNFMHLSNTSTDNLSAINIKLTAGSGNNCTYLYHISDQYSLFDYKYAGTTNLWNDGNGLILRTSPQGRFSFETGLAKDDSYTELMSLTNEGKLGVGTENPEARVQIESSSNGQSGRNFLWLKNNATDQYSAVYLQLSSGDDSRTTLQHRGDAYSIYGDEWRKTSLLWNEGNGLILRTSTFGKVYFEFYDGSNLKEAAVITSDGGVGIGVSEPARSLHVKDVMRLEPRSDPPENPAEGDIYMDNTDHKLKVFDGEQWQSCW